MKISIGNGKEYNVKFMYIKDATGSRDITLCSIHDRNESIFYEASIKRHPKDKDDKRMARTIAFGKALKSLTNDKQLRSYLWNEYNKNTHDLPTVVIK
jgi:hypothetical protein